MEDISEHVLKIKKTFVHYLQGTGHPFPDHCNGLIDPDRFIEENRDPSFRAHCLLKIISGLQMMPVGAQEFTVRL